jgi:hypothetical protein
MDQPIAPITPANSTAIHDAVSTHLRPRRHRRVATHQSPLIVSTPKSTTILERRLARKALLDAPFCNRCFGVYHNKGNYGALASGFL